MELRTISGTYKMTDGQEVPYAVLINEIADGDNYVYRWYILATGTHAGNLIAVWDSSGLLWFNALQFPRYAGLVQYIGERLWEFVLETWERKK